MRKILIAILVVALVSIGVGGYLFTQQGSQEISDPVDAIPTSAALIVSYPDLAKSWKSFEAKDYFDALNGVDEFQSYFARNHYIDSVLTYDEQVVNLFKGSSVWVSYHADGERDLHLFYSVRPQMDRTKQIGAILKRLQDDLGTATQYKLGEQTVSSVSFTDGDDQKTLHFTFKNGLVLISTDENLIKTSIIQLDQKRGLSNDAEFNKALASCGKNVDADFFVNYKHLPSYLRHYFKSEIIDAPSDMGSLASWVELDLNLKDDGFSFNGFAYTNDTLAQYLQVFLQQKPQPINFPDILPANTASFVFFGASDIISLTSDYQNLRKKLGSLEGYRAKIDSLHKRYEIDVENSILAWIGNEFGICVTEPNSVAFAQNSYAVFKARSPELAEKLLGQLADAIDKANGSENVSTIVDSVVFRKIDLSEILPDLLGPSFEHLNNTCYMVLNDHVIFGENTEALADFLHHVRADKTLGKELSFSEFSENLGSSFNIFTYNHISKSKFILESYLNSETVKMFQRNEKRFTKFEAVGSQITSTGDQFYATAFVKYNPKWKSTEQSVWEAKMDAPALTAPVFVKNHHSGELEVLVQDEKNILYLFSRFGTEVFRKQLSEPILSRPKQVDCFKNGNLQYVFNTANYIHLIDRNGDDVGQFPIKLDAEAITDLAVVEYDRKRDYRLLITCENKRIYNYDIKGDKVKGWRHNRASDPTVHPFKHLVVGSKDYLITGESNGKVHLLDRRGKNRTTVEDRIESSAKNTLQPFASKQAAFRGVYLTDPSGKIHRIALDGNVNEMSVGKFSENHLFQVTDLNNDDKPEFIFSDLNMLKVYNYKKEMVFEQRLDPTATEPFVLKLKDGNNAIGLCFQDPEQLLLYDHRGKLVKGFPISGSSRFDLASEEDDYLIVSEGAGTSVIIQAIR